MVDHFEAEDDVVVAWKLVEGTVAMEDENSVLQVLLVHSQSSYFCLLRRDRVAMQPEVRVLQGKVDQVRGIIGDGITVRGVD